MKRKFIAAALAMTFMLGGCNSTKIEYDEPEKSKSPDGSDLEITEFTTLAPQNNDTPVSDFPEEKQEFSQTWQLEGNCDRKTGTSLLGYEGDGYVYISGGEYTTIKVDVPTSQHYKITFKICSAVSKLELIVGGENEIDSLDGSYKTVDGMSLGAIYIEEASSFKDFSVNGVYLSAGENAITINSLTGTAYIDSVTITSGKVISDGYYSVSNAPIDKKANATTVRTMSFLSGIYGKQVLTGQYVTENTNAEINAIYNTTERFPAIRCADLMQYSPYYPTQSDTYNDIELAIDWAKNGGLVSYSWTWYAPDNEKSHYIDKLTNFDFKKAKTSMDLALVSFETVEKLYGDGTIPKECYLLIKDIDVIAEKLKQLSDQDVTVLFRPLMEAGGGWYWWGTDADNYKWLWKTLVDRLNGYHDLHNIIWVWNGENPDFYPGDDYVDIIGEDVYISRMDSAQLRFYNTAYYFANGKSVAMSESAVIPNPDYLKRDNALWLWFSVWRGDYIINSDGSYCGTYTSEEAAKYAYNSQLYITRDELPSLREGGF